MIAKPPKTSRSIHVIFKARWLAGLAGAHFDWIGHMEHPDTSGIQVLPHTRGHALLVAHDRGFVVVVDDPDTKYSISAAGEPVEDFDTRPGLHIGFDSRTADRCRTADVEMSDQNGVPVLVPPAPWATAKDVIVLAFESENGQIGEYGDSHVIVDGCALANHRAQVRKLYQQDLKWNRAAISATSLDAPGLQALAGYHFSTMYLARLRDFGLAARFQVNEHGRMVVTFADEPSVKIAIMPVNAESLVADIAELEAQRR